MCVIYVCMFKSIRKVLRVVFGPKNETEESKQDNIRVKIFVSLALLLVSLTLTTINIITGKTIMMWTTIGLTAVFLTCCLVLYFFKATKISEVLTALAICVIFSYYAISAQNDGFAILWIVIVPAVASLFMSYKVFLAVAIYFLIFIALIFYTPVMNNFPTLKASMDAFYNDQFRIRFPVLYLASLTLSVILSTQSIYYSTISHNNSLFDFLTGLKNRRYCGDYIESLKDKELDPDFTVLSFDINNLKTLNDSFGHDQGDMAIIGAANVLTRVFGKITDRIYRMGGDEFLVLMEDKGNKISEYIQKVETECEKISVRTETLSLSVGYVKSREYIQLDISGLMKISENNMYKYKDDYYKKNNIDRRRKSNLKIDIN